MVRYSLNIQVTPRDVEIKYKLKRQKEWVINKILPIEDCPGKEIILDNITRERYFVTEDGRIFDRYLSKYMSSHINTGYNRVTLRCKLDSNTSFQKSYYVHVLVACVYLGDFRSDKDVNHIDGIKSHNYSSNLEWLTHHENMTHAIKNNLISNRTSLSVNDIHSICLELEKGKHPKDIASDKYNFKTIEGIKNGFMWRNISRLYNIPDKKKYIKKSKEDMCEIYKELDGESPNLTDISKRYNINRHTLVSIYKNKLKSFNKDVY